jgi:tetratricopeptide (TPR) repeat protein
LSWSFGTSHRQHHHALVYSDGNWWYDPLLNQFGYRLTGRQTREWADTTWEFPGPDEYAGLAAEIEPGWFAKAGEKAMRAAVVAGDPHGIDVTAGQHPQYRDTADVLAGLMSLQTRRSYAAELLERSVVGGFEPRDDVFVKKYLGSAGLVIPIAPGVAVALPIMRTAIALTVAELRQEDGDFDSAITVLKMVDRTTHVVLSSVELLCAAGRFDEAIALTGRTLNDDDVSAMTLVYRGIALRETGDVEGAELALSRALEYENRSESVLAFARIVASSDGVSGT